MSLELIALREIGEGEEVSCSLYVVEGGVTLTL